MKRIEEEIQKKAYELGYEKCGIIPMPDLRGYGEKLEERMKKVPGSDLFYENQKKLANISEAYPWAKAVVVAVSSYAKYRVPDRLKGHIGKAYLFDMRLNEESEVNKSSKAFGAYLESLGLMTASHEKFGLVGMRWAAEKAGLGMIRKNNFFYAESGSWVHIEAWLVDQEMVLKEEMTLKPCPVECKGCVNGCPTKSLSEPYTMNPFKCISFLTTFGGRDLGKEPLAKVFGDCIYGCDLCQEVCQMNRGKWVGEENFPGIEELEEHLTPEGIMEMGESFYREKVQPKFFYLSPEELWKWKVNALNFMENNFKENYELYIRKGMENENPKVREFAEEIWKRKERNGAV